MKRKRDDVQNSTSSKNQINDPSVPGNEDFTAKHPNETLFHALSFLDLKGLSQTAQVSIRWRQLTKSVRDKKHEKYLEICQEYNLIFLNAVKDFCITYKKEFEKERKFKEKYKDITFQEMIGCHYDGDKACYPLIAIAASLNAEKEWIFNEEFLNPLEENFFSEKNKEFYNILFNILTYAVTAFIDDSQDAKDKPRLKNLIQQIAQFLIRWQCYLFRNNKGFKIEEEIHKVYKLIEQANNFIGTNISIDYLDETSRNKHLICLQLQLSDFGKGCQPLAYDNIGSRSGDFNYTDLSGSVGLHRFIADPWGGNNAYFTNFEHCEFEEIAPDLMVRVKNITYTSQHSISNEPASIHNVNKYFMSHNEYIYKLGIQSQQPLLREKQEKINQLEERIKTFETMLNQTNPKSEEDKNEMECSSTQKISL